MLTGVLYDMARTCILDRGRKGDQVHVVRMFYLTMLSMQSCMKKSKVITMFNGKISSFIQCTRSEFEILQIIYKKISKSMHIYFVLNDGVSRSKNFFPRHSNIRFCMGLYNLIQEVVVMEKNVHFRLITPEK